MATVFIPQSRVDLRHFSACTDDVLAPSFDDDLSWILETFAQRMCADGTLLTRVRGDRTCETVAATGMVAELPGATVGRDEIFGWIVDAQVPGAGEPLLAWSDWQTADGGGRMLSIPLPPSDGCRLIVSVRYAPGSPIVADAAEAMGTRLYPVMAGYFRLWSKLRAERVRARGLEAALHAFGLGAAVLDRSGEVIFMNGALQRLVDAGDGLRRHGRTLVATDLSSALRFHVALAHAIGEADASPASGKRHAPVLQLKRSGSARPLIAAITPTRPGSEPGDPAAIVCVLDRDGDLDRMLRPICRLHGLSPVETALATHLVRGDVLGDAASSLHIKEQTARAYLKQIFLKTGTNRQGELIRRLLTMIVPLDSSIIQVVAE